MNDYLSFDVDGLRLLFQSKTVSNGHASLILATTVVTRDALISAWISNYIHYEVWDEITYPFLNFNGATVEV